MTLTFDSNGHSTICYLDLLLCMTLLTCNLCCNLHIISSLHENLQEEFALPVVDIFQVYVTLTFDSIGHSTHLEFLLLSTRKANIVSNMNTV